MKPLNISYLWHGRWCDENLKILFSGIGDYDILCAPLCDCLVFQCLIKNVNTFEMLIMFTVKWRATLLPTCINAPIVHISSSLFSSAVLQAIYNMVGSALTESTEDDSPENRTKEIFNKMDINKDNVLSKDEFIKGCMADQFLYQMLTADQSGGAVE